MSLYVYYVIVDLHYYTMILQRIRVIVGYAGFEPGITAQEVFCVNPHLLNRSPHQFKQSLLPVISGFLRFTMPPV